MTFDALQEAIFRCAFLYSERSRHKSETQYVIFLPEKLTQIDMRANEERVLKPKACRFGMPSASRRMRWEFSANAKKMHFSSV